VIVSPATRFVSELLFRLRRSGLPISPAQSIIAAEALSRFPWQRDSVKTALRSILATSATERAIFDKAFDAYFAVHARDRSLAERLKAQGISEAELNEIAQLLQTQAGYLSRGPEFDAALGQELQKLTGLNRPGQTGLHTYKILGRLGQSAALSAFEPLRLVLGDAYGEERASEILALLEAEEKTTAKMVQELVGETLLPSVASHTKSADLAKLDLLAFEQVKRATKTFADKLSAGFRARRRALQKKRFDGPRTMREALKTGGFAIKLHFRARSKRKPKLLVLCDLSDSVKHAARLLLELIAGTHALFSNTRSFVFVSDIVETTTLFHDHSIEEAFRILASGERMSTSNISNYGRALRQFRTQHLASVDRDTTVLILGDGRTNFHDPGLEAIRAITAAARNVYWFVPETRATWSTSDSAMHLYEPCVTRAFEVTTLRDLEEAARHLTR
jgi:uncharacterized protein